MATLSFYPVGNGACSQVVLNNGKRVLIDFYHQVKGEDDSTPIINLEKQLKIELGKEKSFNVVLFTHLDNDHIGGFSDFFFLEHADKYQDKDRIKIEELWVPAAAILETGLDGEDRTLREEAKYRLKNRKGIKVFSKPELLKDWLEKEKINIKDIQHLIVDAGSLVDTFSEKNDSLEVFCHSPFVATVDKAEEITRNSACVVIQFTFFGTKYHVRFLATGDIESDDLDKIVKVTEYNKNMNRLSWDILAISHHCSYIALNSSDKGDKITVPTKYVEKLLTSGLKSGYMVCSSKPIDDNKEAYEQTQPPHIQAKNCYDKYIKNLEGKFLVTMETPSKEKPAPIVFDISADGYSLKGTKKTISSNFASQIPDVAVNKEGGGRYA